MNTLSSDLKAMHFYRATQVPRFNEPVQVQVADENATIPEICRLFSSYLSTRFNIPRPFCILLHWDLNGSFSYHFGFKEGHEEEELSTIDSFFPYFLREESIWPSLGMSDALPLFEMDASTLIGSEREVTLDNIRPCIGQECAVALYMQPASGELMNCITDYLSELVRALSPYRNTQIGRWKGGSIKDSLAGTDQHTQKTNIDVEYVVSLLQEYDQRLKQGQRSGLFLVRPFLLGKSMWLESQIKNNHFSQSNLLGTEVVQLGQVTAKNEEDSFRTLNNLILFKDAKEAISKGELFTCHRRVSDILRKEFFHELGAHVIDRVILQSWKNSADLASFVSFPQNPVAGIVHREFIEFGESFRSSTSSILVGKTAGRSENDFKIDRQQLTKHCLVAGITGSGKTNTVYTILKELSKNNIPFLVIEPTKTEYVSWFKARGFEILAPGLIGDGFSFNPLAFHDTVTPQTHIDLLKSVFNAAFPMYGPMPYLLEEALIESYQSYGWDLASGKNVFAEKDDRSNYFPNLSDLYEKVELVIRGARYSQELSNDIEAALKVRVKSLTIGVKKNVFLRNNKPLDVPLWLSRPTLINLSFLADDEEKCFLMGLILSSWHQYLSHNPTDTNDLRHFMVIEEAHRLLSNVARDTSMETANVKAKALETFDNILSEVRVFGQGICIVDQIPTKLSPDVLRNTDTKIIHRLLSKDDRDIVGDSMVLDENQKREFAFLEPGEAIFFQNGLHEALRVRMSKEAKPDKIVLTHDKNVTCDAGFLISNERGLQNKVKQLFWVMFVHKNANEFLELLNHLHQNVLSENLNAVLLSILVQYYRQATVSSATSRKDFLETKEILTRILIGQQSNCLGKLPPISIAHITGRVLNGQTDTQMRGNVRSVFASLLQNDPTFLQHPSILLNTFTVKFIERLGIKETLGAYLLQEDEDSLVKAIREELFEDGQAEYDWLNGTLIDYSDKNCPSRDSRSIGDVSRERPVPLLTDLKPFVESLDSMFRSLVKEVHRTLLDVRVIFAVVVIVFLIFIALR